MYIKQGFVSCAPTFFCVFLLYFAIHVYNLLLLDFIAMILFKHCSFKLVYLLLVAIKQPTMPYNIRILKKNLNISIFDLLIQINKAAHLQISF